jgi:hypothetical protein
VAEECHSLSRAGDGRDLAVYIADLVVLVDADDWHICRNFEHFQAVHFAKLVGFRERRTPHSAELAVHAEIVLERDPGERLVLQLDRLVLLGLERRSILNLTTGHSILGARAIAPPTSAVRDARN